MRKIRFSLRRLMTAVALAAVLIWLFKDVRYKSWDNPTCFSRSLEGKYFGIGICAYADTNQNPCWYYQIKIFRSDKGFYYPPIIDFRPQMLWGRFEGLS